MPANGSGARARRTGQREVDGEHAVCGVRLALVRHAPQAQDSGRVAVEPGRCDLRPRTHVRQDTLTSGMRSRSQNPPHCSAT